jgi:hypothetical protein
MDKITKERNEIMTIELKTCSRCSNLSPVSKIGEMLSHFVCDPCRTDSTPWEFNKVRISDMEFESPEPKSILENHLEILDENPYR